ncbi:hypothetical protein MARBORIA2_16210 [Methanobrevibacter arboriphilus]|jgi:hypothetical protein|uniref:pseudomurein-binding repeat-containing protein n=1 Tax=Methanobrevibacter arboriphilus TaxID=39441 RepID=UPI0022EF70AC|nr:pseudomurein-binding repeat-containing protein [Methanobrevibacter arboriphilus]GLI12531.1 hypothetical protein MARBORIA2_16210 [Methanobrevibacter arboriphilus]
MIFGGMTILGISRKIISNKYNIIALALLIVFFMGVCVSETSAADSTTNSAVKPNKVSQSQVLSASKNLKTYIEKNKKLPNYITIGNCKYSMEEYMSISSATIVYKNKKSKSNIVVKYGVKSPKSPTGSSISGKLTKKQYSTYASNVNRYINKYNIAPNYASTKLGKIKFQTFIYGNSKILAWSKDNKGILPNTLTLKVSKTHSMNRYVPKFPKNTITPVTPNNKTPTQKNLSITQILKASKQVKSYVEMNNSLPSSVLIDGKQYSMSEFLYLLSYAIVNINKGNKGNITPISVKAPSYPNGNFTSGNFQKGEFVILANNVLNFINTNKQAPNYANSKLGTIKFQSLVYEFSGILDFVDSNGSLPNNLTINISTNPLTGGSNSSNNTNGTYDPIGDGFIIINSSNYTCGPLLVKYNDKYLISTGKCSCGVIGDYYYHNSTFKNYCPFCKKDGCMIYEEGPTCPEGMWVCTICDADFCLVSGKEHINGSTKYLTKTEYNASQYTSNTYITSTDQLKDNTSGIKDNAKDNIINDTIINDSIVDDNYSNETNENLTDNSTNISNSSEDSIDNNTIINNTIINNNIINNIDIENLSNIDNINQLISKEEDVF